MSNLVIKNNNQSAEPNAEKLYLDAMVNKGTIFALDFSNTGMLIDYDLSKGITDLSEGAEAHDNVTTFPQLGLNPAAVIPELTDKKGFPMAFLGGGSDMYSTGIMIQGAGQYLNDNQPHSLFIMWIEMDMDVEGITASRIIRLGQSGGNGYALTVNLGSTTSPWVNISLGGKLSTGNLDIGSDTPTQIAVEWRGGSLGNRFYVNGTLMGENENTEGSFGAPTNDDILAIGGITPGIDRNSAGIVYHASLHDLDVSGMTAQELVDKNYQYVNQLGQYEDYPTKRPYANL